jgi:hypothetical protein
LEQGFQSRIDDLPGNPFRRPRVGGDPCGTWIPADAGMTEIWVFDCRFNRQATGNRCGQPQKSAKKRD